MTAQAALQCLSVNYPKPIMAKFLNSQKQALKMMLPQKAMHQPITGLGNDAIPECIGANTPHIRACRSLERLKWEEGRDFSGSLA